MRTQALTPILEQTRLQRVLILSVEKIYPKMLSLPVVLSAEELASFE